MQIIRTILAAAAMLYAGTAISAIRVIDADDGSPVDAVAVFDASGHGLGLTGADGSLPPGAAGVSRLTLRHVAFETAEVKADTVTSGVIRLTPRTFALPEVRALSNPEYIRVEGYCRSYTSFGNEEFMGTSFAEGTVVYYLKPNRKGNANDSGKTYGYVIYEHITHKKDGVDSLRVKNGKQGGGIVDMMDEGLSLPLLLETKGFADTDVSLPYVEIPGKYSSLGSVRNSGSTITATTDLLSEYKEHKCSPVLLKLFGFTADCTEWISTQTYRADATRPFDISSLVSTSSSIRIVGRGKMFRKIFGGEQVDLRSTTEIFITDISYLDKDAAKEARKADELIKAAGIPASVPPLDPAAAALRTAAIASGNRVE